jgi:hypothetical protein
VCPKCNSNRFMDGSQSIPWKVIRHFPLIPRLLQMYRCKTLAELLVWHKNGSSSDGLVRSVLDSKRWKHIDEKWLDFANEPHNIRLGLVLNGINAFGDLNSCHSTWPVILLNYNLPPWLVTKQYFMMLTQSFLKRNQ